MSKQLGSEDMFRQSLVYLYNSYREKGLSGKDAKKKVAEHIENVYHEYAEKELVDPNVKQQVKPIVNKVITFASKYESAPMKYIVNELERLKFLLK